MRCDFPKGTNQPTQEHTFSNRGNLTPFSQAEIPSKGSPGKVCQDGGSLVQKHHVGSHMVLSLRLRTAPASVQQQITDAPVCIETGSPSPSKGWNALNG